MTSRVLCEFAECALHDLQNPCVTEMAQRSCADQIEIQELRWNVTIRRKNVVKMTLSRLGDDVFLSIRVEAVQVEWWILRFDPAPLFYFSRKMFGRRVLQKIVDVSHTTHIPHISIPHISIQNC